MRLRWIVWVVAVVGLPVALAAGESGLEPPVHVLAGGEPIDTGGIGYAAPFFADFDGDGVRDLLVGEFSQGRMRIFRNVGTDTEPKFEDHEFFKAGSELGRVPSG
jgi:hypothetical protein